MSNFLSLPIILWRCLWAPLIYGGKVVMVLGVLLAGGWSEAKYAWNDSYV